MSNPIRFLLLNQSMVLIDCIKFFEPLLCCFQNLLEIIHFGSKSKQSSVFPYFLDNEKYRSLNHNGNLVEIQKKSFSTPQINHVSNSLAIFGLNVAVLKLEPGCCFHVIIVAKSC